MVQVAILSGIYGRPTPDLVKSFPVNLVPVVEDSGISKGYLRLAPGVRTKASMPSADRGGYVWQGVHYRVIGENLAIVGADGAITTVGSVGAGASSASINLGAGDRVLLDTSSTSNNRPITMHVQQIG